uniref:Uncharacterized protein n=1 Tax=Panagrolaimus sp. ES5 TaxID=591445 RepID=A0AC34F5Z0_9BILA
MKNAEGEVKWAINEYENLMKEEVSEYSTTGCSEDFLKEIDKILLSKIVADICKRNPNEEICTEVLKKFNENRQNIFDKFVFKNKLLLAKESERIRHEQLLKKEEPEVHEKFEHPKMEKPTPPPQPSAAEEKPFNAKELVEDVMAGVQLATGLYKILFPENGQDHNLEQEMERFKKDVQIYIDQRFKGLNTDITYITTAHKYQCCIFYNQGITWTDVLLYYRKNGGDEILRHKERYFYAFKAHRHEGMLKEMLKHSHDIDATWLQALEDCK